MVHISSFLTSTVALSILTAMVNAAEDCNPLKSLSCSPNKALGTDVAYDMSSKPLGWSITTFPDRFSFDKEHGMTLTLKEKLNNPSILSDFYLMFGRVEAHIQAAPSNGIVLSFFLQLDDLDEIDVEMVGSETLVWQLNFFSKGFTGNYDRGAYHPSKEDITTTSHNYTIMWTKDAVEWWFDGALARTLPANNPQGFPQSPMRVFFGLWAGGDDSNQPGTIEWAGGSPDYSKAPFNQYVKLVVVNDFSSGSSYTYGDQTGLWQSIKADGGQVNGRVSKYNPNPSVNNNAVSESSSSATKSLSSLAPVSSSSASYVASSSSSSASYVASSSSSLTISSSSGETSSQSLSKSSISKSIEISSSSSTTKAPTTSASSTKDSSPSSSGNSSESSTALVKTHNVADKLAIGNSLLFGFGAVMMALV